MHRKTCVLTGSFAFVWLNAENKHFVKYPATSTFKQYFLKEAGCLNFNED